VAAEGLIPVEETAANAVEQVAALPRRTAHAAFALLDAVLELNMPPTAAEICTFDIESLGVRETANALASAKRHGLAIYEPGMRLWVPTVAAMNQRQALEDRFLAETEEATDAL
jgi:hypothetical protein